MSSSKEFDSKHHETVNGPAPKRKGGIKRHCARFWWIYVIALIIVILAVVLPIIFVGYPRLAQSGINKAQLVPTAQIIRNPAPDSADLTLDSVLLSDSNLHPDLDSFNGSFYLEGQTTPFVSVTIPAIKAENGTTARVQQSIQITDLAAFTRYTTTLLATKNFLVNLRGSGGLKQGGLPRITVNYNQTINLTGLNALQGLEITRFRLGDDLPFGANSFGNVTIPNPSISTADFGDVTLNLFVGETLIGNSTLPALTLTPGNNSYPLYATANTSAIAGILSQPAYRCGVIPLSIRGDESRFGGVQIPYFTAPLRLATISTRFNLTDTLTEAGFGQLVNGTCET
ncbi:hypothetical protein BDZ85DRAFT_193972 [Elsinoe ampelina]|uniref:Uncharacterized protein n=1 Tax=Elsinoe ampelina TaxID=302913 RepID=A0A6A6GI51_9PEZI|nr:hypothetical protein BDZ85DRAFT_193972 [Elsinoe ampelina]